MSSDDEDMGYEYHSDGPDSPEEAIQATSSHSLPSLSKDKYNKVYDDFQKWNQSKGGAPVNEDLILEFFAEMSEKSKPSTLLVIYSMLKATLISNNNIDISSYSRLLEYIKGKNAGYKPVKSKIFTEEDIEKFINEAPDEKWLHMKVICIFGVNGAYSSNKLVSLKMEHIKQYDDLILVTIPNTENNVKRSFTITGRFFTIVQKYLDARPENINHSRFFLHYSDGKCTVQPIGRNKFYQMSRKIAKYLKLSQAERYTANSFRLATNSLGRNTVAWNPATVAEQQIQYSLDYETGHLRTSSFSYTNPAGSNLPTNNHINNQNCNTTDHVCTITCGQVKCAMQDNENSVLHAFNIMKPLEYTITEVTPATFTSDPTCRWIVAYKHKTEPVSSFNAEQTFEDITRSIPNNVRINEKYIRRDSSQLFAAYIVVYGVNCRCQKQSSDIFSFPLSQIKCEV